MSAVFTDEAIVSLIRKPKSPAGRSQQLPPLRRKRGHAEGSIAFLDADGNDFRVTLRQGLINAFDFSVILQVRVPASNRWFRLRRYNGKSHTHRNPMEGNTLNGFHIHTATERYQRSGWREDSYAELTDRYSDYEGAVHCLIEDANLAVAVSPRNQQTNLFAAEEP